MLMFFKSSRCVFQSGISAEQGRSPRRFGGPPCVPFSCGQSVSQPGPGVVGQSGRHSSGSGSHLFREARPDQMTPVSPSGDVCVEIYPPESDNVPTMAAALPARHHCIQVVRLVLGVVCSFSALYHT